MHAYTRGECAGQESQATPTNERKILWAAHTKRVLFGSHCRNCLPSAEPVSVLQARCWPLLLHLQLALGPRAYKHSAARAAYRVSWWWPSGLASLLTVPWPNDEHMQNRINYFQPAQGLHILVVTAKRNPSMQSATHNFSTWQSLTRWARFDQRCCATEANLADGQCQHLTTNCVCSAKMNSW